MAALPDRYMESLIDLRDLRTEHMAPLLEEEIGAWQSRLDWDFTASADLVRRFVHLRALSGFALMSPAGVAGYSYYVAEEGKGLIGDFFVRAASRTPEAENRLSGSAPAPGSAVARPRALKRALLALDGEPPGRCGALDCRRLPRPRRQPD
jgi:hypothetical protein